MEEEWMRDRALLRDLLEKIPHASPQELAQATGRSGSPGQAMAQATRSDTFQRVAPRERAARAVGRNPAGCAKMLGLFRLHTARHQQAKAG